GLELQGEGHVPFDLHFSGEEQVLPLGAAFEQVDVVAGCHLDGTIRRLIPRGDAGRTTEVDDPSSTTFSVQDELVDRADGACGSSVLFQGEAGLVHQFGGGRHGRAGSFLAGRGGTSCPLYASLGYVTRKPHTSWRDLLCL